MECETKIFEAECNCILYYMPKMNEKMSICGRNDQPCVATTSKKIQDKINSHYACECLPGCFSLSYSSEISMAPLNEHAEVFDAMHVNANNMAVLHVFFNEHYFRSQQKEELVSFSDFLGFF